jgi:hypothetical protein
MSKNYKVVYYFNDEMSNKSFYMTDDNDEIKEMKGSDIFKAGINKHKFRLLLGYDNSKTDLMRFKKDFNEQCDELKSVSLKTKSGKYFSINFKKYFNHNDAVYHNWKKYVDNTIINMFEPIKRTEFYIMERCYNAGLITLNLDYKEKVTKCYSRDFSSYYSNLLVGMKIPFEEGKTYKLNENDVEFGKLKYGIYRIQITYTNSKFSNVFNPSKQHHYTSTILNSIYKYKDYFGLTFKLLEPDDNYNYNALIYEYDQLIDGKLLFNAWLKDMLKVKAKIPKNKLIKHLLSTIGGSLTSFNNEYVEDFSDLDLTRMNSTVDSDYKLRKVTDNGLYKCVQSDNAYKHNLARFKPFLMSLGRKKMFEIIMKNNLIDNVIATHTDRITLTEDYDFSKTAKYFPLPEAKSSGNIIFHNAIHYYKICDICNGEYKRCCQNCK